MKLVRILARVVVVVAPPLLLASALLAAPKNPAPPPKKPPVKWTPKAKDAGAGDDAAKDANGPGKETKLDAKAAGIGASGDVGTVIVKETVEGDAKLVEFGQLGTSEIEGRSRWPAVSYFIRRMRAEFEAQKLPHRSFIPELTASKGDPAVK
jgi:hypothetical protein